MKAEFEKVFQKGVRKHAGIKKQVEQKVRQIMERPIELGEPLKGTLGLKFNLFAFLAALELLF